MRVISFTFRVLSFCGIWLPLKWETEEFSQRRLIYGLFSLIPVCLLTLMLVLQFVLLAASKFNFKSMIDILYTLLILINVYCKVINSIAGRKKIIKLADMFLHSYCLPRDSEELRMKKDVDKFIRLNGISQMATYFVLIKPLFEERSKRQLPIMMWVPYDLYDSRNFWFTWTYEAGTTIIGIFINATVDVIIFGFLIEARLQLDFLNHRLSQLVEVIKHPQIHQRLSKQSLQNFEERIINEAILHHDHIIKIANSITETFKLAIVQQFIISALIQSVIIYVLCIGDVTMIIIVMTILYFVCMIVQLFSYCWFANEITVKSIDFGVEIFKLDWTVLSNKSKKSLILIMLRTSQPIVLSYGSVITLNMESFKSLLKVAYTVFNVLKKASIN